VQAFSSLEALLSGAKGPCLAAINAYGNRIYFQSFGLVKDEGPGVLTVTELIEKLGHVDLATVNLVGDAFTSLPALVEQAQKKKWKTVTDPEFNFPSSERLSSRLIAEPTAFQKLNWTLDWKLIQPLYLRNSEAEELRNGQLQNMGNRIR
jgi:tRNA A37 threonylcarbamoyladenosine modification protein TsaB